MKKIVLKLFLACILLLGINNVEAASLNKGDYFSRVSTGKIGGTAVNLTYSGTVLSINEYKFTGSGVSNVPGYCFDPNVDGTSTLIVYRLLGDTSSNSYDGGPSYDYGLLEILRNGYRDSSSTYTTKIDNGPTVTTSGTELELATSIAIRAYTLGLFGLGKDSGYLSRTMTSTYINEGSHWAATYNNYSSKIFNNRFGSTNEHGRCLSNAEKASNKYDAYLACFKSMNQSYYHSGWYNQSVMFNISASDAGNANYRVYYSAMGLFRDGLEKAADYMDGDTHGVSSAAATANRAEPRTETNLDANYVIDKKVIKFTITDFPENGYVKYRGITCTGCAGQGMTIEKTTVTSRENEIALTTDLDLEDLAKENNGTVDVNIYVRKSTTNKNCTAPTFRLNYVSFDPNKDIIGGILHDRYNTSGTQRYVVAVDADDEIASYVEDTFRCYSVTCQTEIEVPLCQDEDLSNDEWLNKENGANDYIASISAPDNIKACILEKNDDVGNSYRLNSSNSGVAETNPYCQIYCKEDYAAIRMNPRLSGDYQVTCGTYFQLQASIDGSKDCYTSGVSTSEYPAQDYAINKARYLADIEAAQKQMIEGYNKVLMADAAAKVTPSLKSDSCGSSCSNDESATGYVLSGNFTGVRAGTTNSDGRVSFGPSADSYNFGSEPSCSGVYQDFNVEVPGKMPGTTDIVTESRCVDCNCSSGATLAEVQTQIANKRAEGVQEIRNGRAKFDSAVNSYNACTNGWDNEFLFDEIKLSFYYDEYTTTNSYNEVMFYRLLTTSESKLLIPNGDDNEVKTTNVCLGQVSDEYDCLGQTTSVDGAFTSESYTICTESGCSAQSFPVSQATFVKRSVSNSQKYITQSVFYQIAPLGKITVDYNLETGDYLQGELLENVVPVSLVLVGGGNFKLMIQDMGEFYNEPGDEVGRLVDFNYNVIGTNREGDSIAYYYGVTDPNAFDGEYLCQYYSDCRPDDCPNCEFECDPDGNCEFKDCPECVFSCDNCIFNLDELALNFKSVSTNNFGSANRAFGYNWDVNSKVSIILANKAQETIKEIEEANDTIYDDTTKEDGARTDSNLAFSIRLTPALIQYVQDYNDEVEEKTKKADKSEPSGGGYANDTLTCYDYRDTYNNEFENLLCYSEFIDELMENFDGIIIYNRDNVDERSDFGVNKKGYWTLWTDHYGDPINESVIGGPAWK